MNDNNTDLRIRLLSLYWHKQKALKYIECGGSLKESAEEIVKALDERIGVLEMKLEFVDQMLNVMIC